MSARDSAAGAIPPVLAAGLLLGLTLAGCGGGSSAGSGAATAPAARARAAATKAPPSSPAPTSCTSASSVGAYDAGFAARLLLSVDYRNVRQLPAVLEPLLTPQLLATFEQTLTADSAKIVADRATNAITVEAVAYAGGTCAAPVYRVSFLRRSTSAADGVQTGTPTYTATLSWDGSSYLLANLSA